MSKQKPHNKRWPDSSDTTTGILRFLTAPLWCLAKKHVWHDTPRNGRTGIRFRRSRCFQTWWPEYDGPTAPQRMSDPIFFFLAVWLVIALVLLSLSLLLLLRVVL